MMPWMSLLSSNSRISSSLAFGLVFLKERRAHSLKDTGRDPEAVVVGAVWGLGLKAERRVTPRKEKSNEEQCAT